MVKILVVRDKKYILFMEIILFVKKCFLVKQ